MADRYFADEPIHSELVTLGGSEAHHLLHVMRAKAGTAVTLFDGSGFEFAAHVVRLGRTEVELAVDARQEVDRQLPVRITLGVALPKGDRQRWLIEKAVEFGAARLVPLETRRGVAQPAAEVVGRLRRAMIEAAKQCGANRLMEIEAGMPMKQFLSQATIATTRWLAHPGGQPLATLCDSLATGTRSPDQPTTGPADEISLMIGPEGGFTDDEVALAEQQGWQQVSLGRRILRVESAVGYLLAAIGSRYVNA